MFVVALIVGMTAEQSDCCRGQLTGRNREPGEMNIRLAPGSSLPGRSSHSRGLR
jgi:hypothetical protein